MAEHEDTSDRIKAIALIDRREAIRRVGLLLGGVTLVGGSALLTACEKERPPVAARTPIGEFTLEDIDFLDEIAETILPETKTPGAKAAQTGAFMALMVTDTYDARDQKIFRDGMRMLNEASVKANNVGFMSATPQQRLALLEPLDREQKAHSDARKDAREAAERRSPARRDTVKTADTPAHYFRMMKELALLGYFTSEIGCTQTQRYVESPGRFDPCVPYQPGEKTWAPHA